MIPPDSASHFVYPKKMLLKQVDQITTKQNVCVYIYIYLYYIYIYIYTYIYIYIYTLYMHKNGGDPGFRSVSTMTDLKQKGNLSLGNL